MKKISFVTALALIATCAFGADRKSAGFSLDEPGDNAQEPPAIEVLFTMVQAGEYCALNHFAFSVSDVDALKAYVQSEVIRRKTSQQERDQAWNQALEEGAAYDAIRPESEVECGQDRQSVLRELPKGLIPQYAVMQKSPF